MNLILDQLINGLTLGSQYALIAAGLALVFGVLGIVNFAHGELYMLGSYALYLTMNIWNMPYIPGALLALILMLAFGVAFYYLLIRRLLDRGWQIQIVATLAVSLLLVNLAIVVAGPTPKLIESPFTDVFFPVGESTISAQRVVVIGVTILAFVAMYLYLKYARLGKAMRAVSQNLEAAEVVGISARTVGLVAVVAGTALAGIAAFVVAPLVNLQPTMGTLVTLKAFAAVIIGGFGNVTGAVLAGVTLGIVEAFAAGFISSDYADIYVFGLALFVLLVRPQGLFGKVARV